MKMFDATSGTSGIIKKSESTPKWMVPLAEPKRYTLEVEIENLKMSAKRRFLFGKHQDSHVKL